ncbi:MAG: carboxypeptidase-like regulatory domain-containing protein [Fervidobacterium sp.]
MRRRASIIVLALIVALFLASISSGIAAQIVNREQILFSAQNLDIDLMGYRYSGPYSVASGKTIYAEWVGDRLVSVYILNEVDWENWAKYGGPPSYRVMKTAQSGSVQYAVQYSDIFYMVVMGFAGSAARLYAWTEKLVWQETIAGNVTIIVKDEDGNPINNAYVRITGPESNSGYTNSAGEITFFNLAPGNYVVTASKTGFQTATTSITVVKDTTTQTTVKLGSITPLGSMHLDLLLYFVLAAITVAIILYLTRTKPKKIEKARPLGNIMLAGDFGYEY